MPSGRCRRQSCRNSTPSKRAVMKRFWAIVGFLGLAILVAGAVVFLRMAPAERSPSARAQDAPRPARAGVPVETSTARLVPASDDIRAIGSLQSDESVK